MEETDKTEMTKLREYIHAELERIGCKNINILTVPVNNTGSTEISHALKLDYFINDNNFTAIFYDVLVTKCIDQNWNDRLRVKVLLTRSFTDGEMIPLSALNVDDTLTVIKQWDDSVEVRLEHRVSGSITCKTPCDADTARELVKQIFEISKL